jgi:hypothetical protein
MNLSHFLTQVFKPNNFSEEELDLILEQFIKNGVSEK